jgi:glycosyltransferase involved in cell wall biosynthesis
VTAGTRRGLTSAQKPRHRVLFVIHFPVFGGPHNQALRLAKPLSEKGWETVVLLPAEPGGAAERLRDGGVEVATLPLHRVRAVADPRPHLRLALGLGPEIQSIRRLIREQSIDVVQIGGLVNPHAALAARLEHVPIVWQLLDTRTPRPVALVPMALVHRLAKIVMSTGRLTAEAHPGGSTLGERLITFFPPVDIDAFRPNRDERQRVRNDWGVENASPVIGCVANINPQKGIVDLVRAFILVRQRVPNARLVLIGAEYRTHESYSQAVRQVMVDGGLTEGRDVIFRGERTDVELELSGFDVFAFAPTPHGEGISTCVLEAMACGLPVVSTSVAGLPDAIEDGVSGRLVGPSRPDSMADAIVSLLQDPILAATMGNNARSRAVALFSIDKCVEDHIHAYEQALSRSGGRKSRRAGSNAVGRARSIGNSIQDGQDTQQKRES